MVANAARKAASQIVTAAASLDRCSLPTRSTPESLPGDEVEFGIGKYNHIANG